MAGSARVRHAGARRGGHACYEIGVGHRQALLAIGCRFLGCARRCAPGCLYMIAEGGASSCARKSITREFSLEGERVFAWQLDGAFGVQHLFWQGGRLWRSSNIARLHQLTCLRAWRAGRWHVCPLPAMMEPSSSSSVEMVVASCEKRAQLCSRAAPTSQWPLASRECCGAAARRASSGSSSATPPPRRPETALRLAAGLRSMLHKRAHGARTECVVARGRRSMPSTFCGSLVGLRLLRRLLLVSPPLAAPPLARASLCLASRVTPAPWAYTPSPPIGRAPHSGSAPAHLIVGGGDVWLGEPWPWRLADPLMTMLAGWCAERCGWTGALRRIGKAKTPLCKAPARPALRAA